MQAAAAGVDYQAEVGPGRRGRFEGPGVVEAALFGKAGEGDQTIGHWIEDSAGAVAGIGSGVLQRELAGLQQAPFAPFEVESPGLVAFDATATDLAAAESQKAVAAGVVDAGRVVAGRGGFARGF